MEHLAKFAANKGRGEPIFFRIPEKREGAAGVWVAA